MADIDLPVPGVTPSPEWAPMLNTAIEEVNTAVGDVANDITALPTTLSATFSAYREDLVLRGPGIDPTGATSSSAAFQTLTRLAQSANGKLVIPPGEYYAPTEISTSESFIQPKIEGSGAGRTIIRGGGSNRILRFRGGSGSLSGGYLSDVTLKNAGDGALVFDGCGGFNAERISIQDSALGVLWWNSTSGQFTEFCVLHDSDIAQTVTRAAEYRRDSGNDSFHGSGFQNTVINQASSNSGGAVLIGAGALVYNAPLNVTFFGRNTNPLISNLGQTATTFGEVRLESNSAQNIVGDNPIYHSGSLLLLGTGPKMGRFIPRDGSMTKQADGAYRNRDTVTYRKQFTTTGTFELGNYFTPGVYSLSLQGTNYSSRTIGALAQVAGLDRGVFASLASDTYNSSSGISASWGASSTTGQLQLTISSISGTLTADIEPLSMMPKEPGGPVWDL